MIQAAIKIQGLLYLEIYNHGDKVLSLASVVNVAKYFLLICLHCLCKLSKHLNLIIKQMLICKTLVVSSVLVSFAQVANERS